ncbi:MAG: hypothetical protein WC554_14560 [Clostridia bacterium]
MKNKFTKTIAKEIAQRQFVWTIGCTIGTDDPDYDLMDPIDEFEQNFTEDLEERNIIATPKRIEIINKYYEQKVQKVLKYLNRLQCTK